MNVKFSTRNGKVDTVNEFRRRAQSSETYKVVVLWFETKELKLMPSQIEHVINYMTSYTEGVNSSGGQQLVQLSVTGWCAYRHNRDQVERCHV